MADDLDFWLSREEPCTPEVPAGKEEQDVELGSGVTQTAETEKVS